MSAIPRASSSICVSSDSEKVPYSSFFTDPNERVGPAARVPRQLFRFLHQLRVGDDPVH